MKNSKPDGLSLVGLSVITCAEEALLAVLRAGDLSESLGAMYHVTGDSLLIARLF